MTMNRPNGTNWSGLSQPFPDQRSDQIEWCWGAVAAAIGTYLETRGAGNPWRQCEVVGRALKVNNCCVAPTTHNQRGDLTVSLMAVDCAPNQRAEDVNGPPLLEDIAAYITGKDRPMCLRIKFGPGNAAHFVAILWCNVVTREIAVFDPDQGGLQIRSYARFPANHNPSGEWTHSYFPAPLAGPRQPALAPADAALRGIL